jgi:hypothetical protein
MTTAKTFSGYAFYPVCGGGPLDSPTIYIFVLNPACGGEGLTDCAAISIGAG